VSTRTQAFVLMLFGGALVRLSTGDALLRYVRPLARPWVMTAGLAILGIAVWSLIAAGRGRDAEEIEAHGHHSTAWSDWLILLPVIAIAVIAPPALGAFTARREPVHVSKPSGSVIPSLPKGDPVRISLVDFAVRALWHSGDTLVGRNVELTAFVTDHDRDGFTAARLVITCCAADARPIYVDVFSDAVAPAQDAWVTIDGTFAGVRPRSTTPLLRATSVQVVGTPANPYDS
jgi:uncharacterized repeat protein (TIGR03943 family)